MEAKKMKKAKMPQLDYRISIAYGSVRIAKVFTSSVEDIFGSTVNKCSKINRLAKPNGIVIGNSLYRIIKSLDEQYVFEKIESEEMVEKYTVRTETDLKVPVVAPPAGADVFLIARLWSWWPILELEKGVSYRLHLTAMDYQHGFSLQPENINVQVLPGYEHVITIKPNRSGTYAIVCNEFCGIGHHKMVSKLYVK